MESTREYGFPLAISNKVGLSWNFTRSTIWHMDSIIVDSHFVPELNASGGVENPCDMWKTHVILLEITQKSESLGL